MCILGPEEVYLIIYVNFSIHEVMCVIKCLYKDKKIEKHAFFGNPTSEPL